MSRSDASYPDSISNVINIPYVVTLYARRSCAYNPHGDLVVVDSGHWRACIFAPDGEMIHAIGDRLSLQASPLGKPLVCSFGRDYVGNLSVLVGYSKGIAYNYGLPPPVIKGDMSHLPTSAVLQAFSYLDFRACATAGETQRVAKLLPTQDSFF